MPYQFTLHATNARPFPPRKSHMRACIDGRDYVDQTAPTVAQEWLQWLAGDDDPDFDQRGDDHDYVLLVYSSLCDEGEALRLARRWVWDQIEIIKT